MIHFLRKKNELKEENKKLVIGHWLYMLNTSKYYYLTNNITLVIF